MRDAEIDDARVPGHRQRRGERHPERQLGNGAEHLGDALHDGIEEAAVIAGDAADDDADRVAERHADQADGERNPRAVDEPREHVAPEPVGAEQEHRPVRRAGRSDGNGR